MFFGKNLTVSQLNRTVTQDRLLFLFTFNHSQQTFVKLWSLILCYFSTGTCSRDIYFRVSIYYGLETFGSGHFSEYLMSAPGQSVVYRSKHSITVNSPALYHLSFVPFSVYKYCGCDGQFSLSPICLRYNRTYLSENEFRNRGLCSR